MVRRELPQKLKKELGRAICSLHSLDSATQVLQSVGAARFEEVDDATYDDLRQMLAAVEDSGIQDFGPV